MHQEELAGVPCHCLLDMLSSNMAHTYLKSTPYSTMIKSERQAEYHQRLERCDALPNCPHPSALPLMKGHLTPIRCITGIHSYISLLRMYIAEQRASPSASSQPSEDRQKAAQRGRCAQRTSLHERFSQDAHLSHAALSAAFQGDLGDDGAPKRLCVCIPSASRLEGMPGHDAEEPPQ